jgi:cell wall-associated NlpC family hydrolase
MAVNGAALAAVGVGSVFTYAGIKGYSVPQAFQSIVQGKNPAKLKNTHPIDTPVELPSSSSNNAVGGGTATGQAIANDSMKYQGTSYVWGGPADKPGNWDCSSFVSKVLGQDFGYTLPGGGHWGSPGYPPNAHGPTTTEYQTYGTAISRAQVGAGDLLVWPDHIGIAINTSTMISAQDEKLGTGTSTIDGTSAYFGASPNCRRVGT